MKVGQFTRELMVQEYKNRIETADFLLFTNFKDITADDMRLVRAKLKQSSTGVIVVRNNLFKRMLAELEMPGLMDYVNGELAVVYGVNDPVSVVKQIQELSKNIDGFVIKGGFIEHKVLTAGEVKKIAAIPSREVLLAQLINIIKSPISNLVFVLKGNIQSLVNVIKQIKEKRKS